MPAPLRTRRSWALPWAALLLALLASYAAAAPASAHAGLIGSDPAEGEELARTPSEVSLEFNEDISEPAYVVLRADGQEVQQGTPQVEGGTVTQAVAADAPAGAWTMAFRVVSVDGHPVTGEVAFDVVAAPEPSPEASAESSAAAPQAASESPSGVAGEQGTASARVGEDDFLTRYGGYVLLGAALLAVAGLVLLPARRRTR